MNHFDTSGTIWWSRRLNWPNGVDDLSVISTRVTRWWGVKYREVNFLIIQNMIFFWRHFEGIERCWWNLFYDSVPGVLDVHEQSNGVKSAVVFLGEKNTWFLGETSGLTKWSQLLWQQMGELSSFKWANQKDRLMCLDQRLINLKKEGHVLPLGFFINWQ